VLLHASTEFRHWAGRTALAGFEFFTDLILADFLVSYTPFIKSVVFHPKQIPWFVSDVTPPDARALFGALINPETYFSSPPPSPAHLEALEKLRYRWLKYFEEGTFSLNGCPGLDGGFAGGSEDLTKEANGMEFWTRPGDYEELSVYPRMAGLEGSGLAIFKEISTIESLRAISNGPQLRRWKLRWDRSPAISQYCLSAPIKLTLLWDCLKANKWEIWAHHICAKALNLET